ncbi:hypothetical protein [Planktothrix mougeotii]|uniref:Uncharacterized protein n=1 Tax=Planktothrix mougeotii LEGE 06226 TaxID=1828728 RepID=A0ABR9U5K5_9CYAN|nr:hypothetical protein [Planktothrix mougeotii]MBE9141726.1 hypothetical protein [Planktothrix mougeotii LEGE 06226]
MVNGIALCKEKKRLDESAIDAKNIQYLLQAYLNPNSLDDEIQEFFREVAALKGKSVQDTLKEMEQGTQKYLEAIDMEISFKNDIPTDIEKYVDKITKLSQGIESCWDLFSEESHDFFIKLAYDFSCQHSINLQGWRGLQVKLKLLLPSLKRGKNLFKDYQNSFLLIPQAVDRAVELRKSKSTSQLWSTAQTLLKQAKLTPVKQPKLSSFLKHLGQTPEEQIKNNQAAMNWAKERLQAIQTKWDGDLS